MKISDHIEYSAVAGLLGLCRILPESWVFGCFKGLGLMFHTFLIQRRKLALRNMEIAFPDKPLAERSSLVRQHFINLSESMALNALIMSGRITNERLLDMVDCDDWERFEQVSKADGIDLLVFSAHLGNWELMPQYIALRLRRQISVIARKGSNALLEERIVRPLRERFSVGVLYKQNAMMRMIRALRNGDIVGILIDQKLNLAEGISVPFFGKEAGTTATPAILQIRFGVTTLPMFMVKAGKHRYRLIIGDPVQWQDNGKPQEQQVAELTCLHQRLVEDKIREYPDQWFWVHDRWRLGKVTA